jgi:hypothetical protein
MPRRLVSMIVALLVLLGPSVFVRSALADDRVDVLLVLAADVSRSVDDRKFPPAARGLCGGDRRSARGAGHGRRPDGTHRHLFSWNGPATPTRPW